MFFMLSCVAQQYFKRELYALWEAKLILKSFELVMIYLDSENYPFIRAANPQSYIPMHST